MYQEDYRGKHQLAAINRMEFCLDASPKRKLTSKEVKRGTFSPCRWDANQACCVMYLTLSFIACKNAMLIFILKMEASANFLYPIRIICIHDIFWIYI